MLTYAKFMAENMYEIDSNPDEDDFDGGFHRETTPSQEEQNEQDEGRPRKRRRLNDEDQDSENGQDAEVEKTEEERHIETQDIRANCYGLKAEVEIRIEHLRAPYKEKKGKKGGLQPNDGSTKKDYESPYPLLTLPIYEEHLNIGWVRNDIARHCKRPVDEIDWAVLKWCLNSAARTNYTLVGEHSDNWYKCVQTWAQKTRGKTRDIAMLVTFLPPKSPPPQAPLVNEEEEAGVESVAGKENPLRGLLTGGTMVWRKKLEEAHPVGACPIHKTSRCAQRDGLHFILLLPQLTAWSCYLNMHPDASLDQPPLIPAFASSKATDGRSRDSLTASDSVSQSGANSEASIRADAIQAMTLALMGRLLPPVNDAPQRQPDPVQSPPPTNYGSVAARYRNAPSMEEFCTTYSLGDSQAKFEAVGFKPGDTPEDLALLTGEELKAANILTLEWRRLKNAVADYCAKLAIAEV